MKVLIKRGVLLLFVLASTGIYAQSDSIMRFSLKDALVYAMENNRSILNSNLDIEIAKKKVWETTAIGLPGVSSSVSASYIITMPDFYKQFITPQVASQIAPGTPDSARILDENVKKILDDMRFGGSWDVQVSQLIFSGSYLVGLQASKVYKSLSELNRVKSVQDVIESVTNTYFMILVAEENADLLDSTYKNVEKTHYDMVKMYQQGFVEETDVDQMSIVLANMATTLNMVRRQTEIAKNLFKVQLGIDIEEKVELTDSLDMLIATIAYEQLLTAELVLDENVTYQMLSAQVKSNELLLKLNKSTCLPDIFGFYQHSEQLNTKAISFTPPDMVGVTVNIPLFASGSRWAKISQAKMELEKSKNMRSQASEMLRVQFYQSKSDIVLAKDRYITEKANLGLSKKIYLRALIKFQNGLISGTELSQVHNQFLTVQSSYYQAIQSLITEKNNLEKILSKN